MKMVYLASPYSHKDPAVRQQRYEAAVEAVARLTTEHVFTYSPIVHCHPPAVLGGLPTNAAWWSTVNIWFIEHMDEFWLLPLVGWQESVGVKAEIELAKSLNKPVVHVQL